MTLVKNTLVVDKPHMFKVKSNNYGRISEYYSNGASLNILYFWEFIMQLGLSISHILQFLCSFVLNVLSFFRFFFLQVTCPVEIFFHAFE